MEKIKQYYLITGVKPEYHELNIPYYKSSKKKILFNEKELELFYDKEFDVFVESINAALSAPVRTGGCSSTTIMICSQAELF